MPFPQGRLRDPIASDGTGQSIVRLNHSVGQGFWHAFDYDSLPAFMQQHGLKQLGPPGH